MLITCFSLKANSKNRCWVFQYKHLSDVACRGTIASIACAKATPNGLARVAKYPDTLPLSTNTAFEHTCWMQLFKLPLQCSAFFSSVLGGDEGKEHCKEMPLLTCNYFLQGSGLQRPPLAWEVLQVHQMQPLSGRETICCQGWALALYWMLLQWVFIKVFPLPEDHYAW